MTVFPVPVAPAIRPWRFAILGSKKIDSFDCATKIGSAMIGNYDFANGTAIVQRWSPNAEHLSAIAQLRHAFSPGAKDQAADRESDEWPAHVDENQRPRICLES